MQNEVQMQIFESLQCHYHVGFDIRRREHDFCVFDDVLQVRVAKIENQTHIRFMAENIQQADQILMLQFVQQFYLSQSGAILKHSTKHRQTEKDEIDEE